MKAANLMIKGIKYDNPNCDFMDNTVEFKDYKDWLNKPCPKCGENLLTQKDLDAVKALIKITNIVNWIMKPFIQLNNNTKRTIMIAEMNGTGQVKFKPKD